MIHIDVEQGTTAWAMARLGIPTASQMSRIITPTGKLSSQADAYMHQLLAEQILGEPLDDATSGFMQRGTILEERAIQFYELQNDCEIRRVGFIKSDDGRVGCSPDGLVGHNGGVEIKIPSASVHVGYLLGDAGEKYKCQVQCGLWITEAEFWDFLSWNPELPPVFVRFTRDEDFIGKMAAAVRQFNDYMDESKIALQRYGLFTDFRLQPLKVVA